MLAWPCAHTPTVRSTSGCPVGPVRLRCFGSWRIAHNHGTFILQLYSASLIVKNISSCDSLILTRSPLLRAPTYPHSIVPGTSAVTSPPLTAVSSCDRILNNFAGFLYRIHMTINIFDWKAKPYFLRQQPYTLETSLYRPPDSSLFESWMEVIKEVVAREPHKSGNISFKICLEVTEIFPFIRIKVAGLAEEMKNSVADEGTRDHVSDILTTLSSFVKEQQKAHLFAEDEKGEGCSQSSGPTRFHVPPPSLGVSTPTQRVMPGPQFLNPPSSNAAAVNIGLNAASTTPGLNPTALANLMQMTFTLAVFGFPDGPTLPPQMNDVD